MLKLIRKQLGNYFWYALKANQKQCGNKVCDPGTFAHIILSKNQNTLIFKLKKLLWFIRF